MSYMIQILRLLFSIIDLQCLSICRERKKQVTTNYLHVNANDAYLCMNVSSENGKNIFSLVCIATVACLVIEHNISLFSLSFFFANYFKFDLLFFHLYLFM